MTKRAGRVTRFMVIKDSDMEAKTKKTVQAERSFLIQIIVSTDTLY